LPSTIAARGKGRREQPLQLADDALPDDSQTEEHRDEQWLDRARQQVDVVVEQLAQLGQSPR